MSREKKEACRDRRQGLNISISEIFILMMTALVTISSVAIILVFVQIYRSAMEESAVTSSDQICSQVVNTVEKYTADMEHIMDKILGDMKLEESEKNEAIQNIVEVQDDIVAVTTYDRQGNRRECWSAGLTLKEESYQELSYVPQEERENGMNITKPHVTSIFKEYYPWVVTMFQNITDENGEEIQVAMDIRFSSIANYIDDVGIGPHGYCYIADKDGNLIYHPQQQFIYSGLKEEKNSDFEEGVYKEENAIYTVRSLKECDWKIIGVCYVDEMITEKVRSAVQKLLVILCLVMVVIFIMGWAFSELFSSPIRALVSAMQKFETKAEDFTFQQVKGTTEITTLSESFAHMVVRIQRLMEKVRQEEINLRKTELKALQAQINPHFLYNTLDAIAWMCEEGKNQEAEEMVTSLARLFRISISRGHELISVEKEVQHAQSYLRIQSHRYKNQFTYSFEVQEECLPYMCNKITLQPIIENAIYHGVNQMVEEGRIIIRIFQEKDDIIFQVEDNGVGMTKEQCREILYQESGDKTGIGIKNVNDRIKIYFGEEYGLSIASEPDEGTCITMRMPKVEESDYEKRI